VSGWGLLGDTKETMPQILQVVEVPFITYDNCRNIYSDIKHGMICAGESEGGKDACQISIPSLLTSSEFEVRILFKGKLINKLIMLHCGCRLWRYLYICHSMSF
jgi:hypothetical protein